MTSFSQDFAWSIAPFIPPVDFFQDVAWEIGASDETVTLVLNAGVGNTGLVGILTVQISSQDDDVVVYGPTTQNIVEFPDGTGRYVATVPQPAVGRYFVTWTDGVTTTEPVELLVMSDARVQPPLRTLTEGQYEAKVGDLQPPLIQTLVNADDSPIDLTFADSVVVRVRRLNGGILLERAAFVLDAEGGEVMLDWEDGEQDDAGSYDVEWQINWSDGGTATVPSRGFYRFTRYGSLLTAPSNRWPGVS